MQRVAFALGGALLAARAGAEEPSGKWTEWDNCGSTVGLTSAGEEAEASMRFSSDARGLAEALDREELRTAHQLVYLNNYTGKLEVNHEALVWQELENVADEVNVIVMYGYYGRGRSTLASMLGCAMNNAANSTTIFPAQRIVETTVPGGNVGFPHTLGIWASDPFVYSGPDGEGPPRTFMIVDTQGLDHKHQIIDGLSRKITNDAAIKIIAMLTEVASEFVYISADRHAELLGTDYDNLGLAFKSTRENLIKSSEEWAETEEEQELNIRSINHPGLLFLTRETIETDIVNGQDFSFNSATWEAYAKNNYEGVDSKLKALIDMNFAPHTVNTGGADQEIGFLYNPFPEMSQQLDGDTTFKWLDKSMPFPLEYGASCAAYQHMAHNDWACKYQDGDGHDSPTSPPTFKLMLDQLAAEIYAHAPVRQVAWGALAPQNLTGARLKGFLEASVTEINKAGPVADNELWRLIMEDRCAVDLNKEVDQYYQHKYDLLDADAIPARTGQLNEHEIASQNATFEATWKTTIEQFDQVVANFFLVEVLLDAVKDECTAFARTTMERLNAKAQKLFAEMAFLGEQAATNRIEEERQVLEDLLTQAQKDLDDLWWQANLPYIIAFAALGVGALMVVMSVFRTATGTLQACGSCCMDFSSKDTDHTVTHVTRYADGAELTNYNHNMGVGLMAAPVPSAPMAGGYHDPQLTSRIEELEEVVLRLAARVPQRDLQAMGFVAPVATPARLDTSKA